MAGSLRRSVAERGPAKRRRVYGRTPAPRGVRVSQAALTIQAMSSAQSQGTPAERREQLKQVFAQAKGCERCPELAATRKTVVFGSGNADAELMFVGEAPGASEDEQG